MATNSRARMESLTLKKHQGRESNLHERTEVRTQKRGGGGGEGGDQMLVPVVYYLSRNGQLEHPHFIEVPLSSSQGLFLKDVINRLDSVRGQGMAIMYSWSSKRSYKNGYVWQDLSGNDLIHPCHGHEFILKGSPLLETSPSFRAHETATSATSSSSSSLFSNISSDTNTSTFNIYRARTSGELGSFRAIHVSTQTDDDAKVRKIVGEGTEAEEVCVSARASDSVSEVVDGLEQWGGGSSADIRDQTAGNERPSGRFRAAVALMHLISCGSTRYPA